MRSEPESATAQAAQLPPEDQSSARRFLSLLRGHPGLFWNLLREEYRRCWGIPRDRRRGNGLSGLPVNLSLNLTRRCNLKCRMCEQHRHEAGRLTGLTWYDPDRELPLSAWTDLLEQVADFRPRLYLTGGEPTLYEDFPGVIREAKKLGLLVHLQTNGTRLTRIADLLATAGVEMVTVSLDGPAEVHDFIRGQTGVFRRTTEGIAALVAARKCLKETAPLLIINCTISKANLAILDQMAPLALELGADILQMQHTMFNSEPNVARHNLLMSPLWAQFHGVDLVNPSIPPGEFYESEISPEDLPLLQDRLKRTIRLARGRLKLNFLPNLPLDKLASYYLDLGYPEFQECNALWKSCRVLPDGTVSPCLHVTAGNITAQPFREIWNGPGMRNFRRVIGRHLLPGCVRCCNRSFK